MKKERRSFKVLLLEDHQGYAKILLKRLSKHNDPSFQILHDSFLRSGLKSLAEQRFDVILTDLSLPDSQGLDTFTFLQAQASEIPLVILTALDDENLGVEAVRRGAQDYLIKDRVAGEDLPRILQYAIERNQAQLELRDQSLKDALTGLSNRHGFSILAQQQMKLSRRRRRPMLLLFIDVDGLKKINDAYGHRRGDEVLQDVAKILRSTFRESDVVARIGGDEFVVLAIDAGDENRQILLQRLEAKLQDFRNGVKSPQEWSLSVGAAQFNPACPPVSIEQLIEAADRAMYAQKRMKACRKREGKKKILIVEDETAISRPLARHLASSGFEVSTAKDGKEGLEKARGEAPDLILLDLVLTGLPGEEICKTIRLDEDEKFARTPIIMLTAKATDVDRVLGKVLGASSYITKPFDDDELLKEIRRFTNAC